MGLSGTGSAGVCGASTCASTFSATGDGWMRAHVVHQYRTRMQRRVNGARHWNSNCWSMNGRMNNGVVNGRHSLQSHSSVRALASSSSPKNDNLNLNARQRSQTRLSRHSMSNNNSSNTGNGSNSSGSNSIAHASVQLSMVEQEGKLQDVHDSQTRDTKDGGEINSIASFLGMDAASISSDLDDATPGFDRVSEAIDEIKKGNFVVVLDDEDRENEGDLIIAANHVTPEKMAFMNKHTSGIICVSLKPERCKELELPLMVPREQVCRHY